MPVIKAQKIPRRVDKPLDIVARFCYYFPQYTFDQARRMPFVRIKQMLRVARQEMARQNIELLRISTAPHSKKGAEVKKMLEYLREIVDNDQ